MNWPAGSPPGSPRSRPTPPSPTSAGPRPRAGRISRTAWSCRVAAPPNSWPRSQRIPRPPADFRPEPGFWRGSRSGRRRNSSGVTTGGAGGRRCRPIAFARDRLRRVEPEPGARREDFQSSAFSPARARRGAGLRHHVLQRLERVGGDSYSARPRGLARLRRSERFQQLLGARAACTTAAFGALAPESRAAPCLPLARN